MSGAVGPSPVESGDGQGEYVLVDDNGEPIPLEAEASVLLAAAAASEGLPAMDEFRAATGDALTSCGGDGEEFAMRAAEIVDADVDGRFTVPTAAAFGLDGVQAGQALLRLLQDDTASAASPQTAPAEPPVGRLTEDDDGADADCMDDRGFSREYSDAAGDDAWVLERILRRRFVKRPVTASDLDYADDGAGCRAATGQPAGSSGGRVFEYLCKWKWYADPTWEPRNVLEHFGYLRQASAFDATIAPQRALQMAEQPSRRIRLSDDAFGLFRGILRWISHELTDINRVAELPVRRDFLATAASQLKRNPGSSLVRVFHGTRERCVRPICRDGLKVGGRGVAVANGTVHGTGVYTATNADFARQYCRRGHYMFLCVGILGQRFVSYHSRNIVVFPSELSLTPAWLLEFGRGGGTPTEFTSLSEMLADLPADPAIPEARNSRIAAARSAAEASRGAVRGPMSKKMLKQAPRFVKDLYHQGLLRPKSSTK